jgi:hypothetical protein
MSHFTVMVKVKKDRLENHDGDLESAVREMLLPFQEEADEQYMTFIDCTQEIEDSLKTVIEKDDYLAKENPDAVGKTLDEFYGGFDNVAKKYHSYRKDPATGKYGYQKNPNAKWDWYQIGGRWSGLLPVKQTPEGKSAGGFGARSWCNEAEPYQDETADYCKVKDLNIAKMEADVLKSIDEFWKDYNDWLTIKDLSHKELLEKYGGKPDKEETDETRRWRDLSFWFHDRLMRMGVGKCVKPREPLNNPDGTPVMEEDNNPFDKGEKKLRQVWSDPVFEYAPLTKDELYSTYRWYFEFSTFAVLDDEGWKEKGEMGWWGMSSDSTEDREEWSKSYFQSVIANEDPETTLVVVDCHI